jgi:very-short-patch-repair endonuclease
MSEEVKARCRNFRKEPTVAELILWRHIRDRQIGGAKFRRQHSVGPYILDFYCDEFKLCIELDGGGHLDPEQELYDQERTEYLKGCGIRVTRFWNNDIFNHLDAVLDVIFQEVQPN